MENISSSPAPELLEKFGSALVDMPLSEKDKQEVIDWVRKRIQLGKIKPL
jgi:hypothetical protein